MTSPKLIEVPYGDGLAWSRALVGHEASARRLLDGFARQVRTQVEPVLGEWSSPALWTFKKMVRTIHAALGETYVDEFREVADTVGVALDDLLVANLAYDLANCAGCSTFVLNRAGPPLHARNLDWPFPSKILRHQTTVFHTAGAPVGDYAMVGWPGFVGALTGVATGRFSVTVNYVSHNEESAPHAAVRRVFAGHWPVPWVVRKALDECESFDEAVSMLSETPLLSPVLFTVAGPKRGEAVAIERGPSDYVHRKMEAGVVRTTNHYVTPAYAADNNDLSEHDSVDRYDRLGERLAESDVVDPDEALDVLSDDLLLSDITQHQVVMCPKSGLLVVSVPEGERLEIEVADRQFSVECPTSGEAIVVGTESGSYVCPDCEGGITVDDGGIDHEAMVELECPETEAIAIVPVGDDDDCECPWCGRTIEVENGEAAHVELLTVQCPVSDDLIDLKDSDEDGEWTCPDCHADITVSDGRAEHAEVRFVTCPESGARIGFPVDADDRCCPDCGADLAVVNGRAKHGA